jgi:hypothetical protein
VLLLREDESAVFVESGETRLSGPRAKGAAAVPSLVRAGQFYSIKGAQTGALAPRPAPAFVAALPRLFLDPLPSRMARYRDRPSQPRQLNLASYAEVEAWLKAPYAIRRAMPARFKSRADDPAFRAALVANLRFHPEWDRILFPEKYRPRESTAPAALVAPPSPPAGAERNIRKGPPL